MKFDRALDGGPIWSPDRSRIVFWSDREGGRNLFWKAANGTTQEELLYKSSNQNVPEDWSRDGKYILFTSIAAKSGGDITANLERRRQQSTDMEHGNSRRLHSSISDDF